MKSILISLVLMLMRINTGVAFAQAPKNDMSDRALLNKRQIEGVRYKLAHREYFTGLDSLIAERLLENNNTPLRGEVKTEEKFACLSKVKEGDTWNAYISIVNGSLWLTYILNRQDEYLGRIDVGLE